MNKRVVTASLLYLCYFIQLYLFGMQRLININIVLVGGGGFLEILYLFQGEQDKYKKELIKHFACWWGISMMSWYSCQPLNTIRSIVALQLSDALQYIVGSRYPLFHPFPSLSPNKSIGGYLGGIGLAMFIPIIYNIFFGWKVDYFSYLLLYLLGCLGDLGASYVKRAFDIKDYSNILGSHGGIVDRFDSILLAGPVGLVTHLVDYW